MDSLGSRPCSSQGQAFRAIDEMPPYESNKNFGNRSMPARPLYSNSTRMSAMLSKM